MTSDYFFSELKKITNSFPKEPATVLRSESCEFCNEVYDSKNMFYCFDSYKSTDSSYIFDSFMCANCLDCDYAVEAQLCYECVDPYKAFNCNYVEYCDNIRDSSYCYNCSNCNDVFGCANLKNKSFCIFNRQLTESEYKEQIKKYRELSPQEVLHMVDEIKKKFPLTQTIGGETNENSDFGNYIHYSRNCYLSFDAAHDQDCGYLYDSFYCKTSYDLTYVANNVELTYEAIDSIGLFNCNFITHSADCQDSFYLLDCSNVKNSIGCVSLKNKEFCILNRQLTKEQYQIVSEQLLKELKDKNSGWDSIEY